jgi:hypothetical protein
VTAKPRQHGAGPSLIRLCYNADGPKPRAVVVGSFAFNDAHCEMQIVVCSKRPDQSGARANEHGGINEPGGRCFCHHGPWRCPSRWSLPCISERASAGEKGTEKDRYVEFAMKKPRSGKTGARWGVRGSVIPLPETALRPLANRR